MKTRNIKIYFWLIDTLLDAGEKGMMLTQIQQKFCDDFGEEEYQRRTFINHRKDILELFGIEIACRISNRRYYISNENSIKDFSRFRLWMYDAISATIISEKMLAMSDRVVLPHVEGADLIPDLVKAISQHRKIVLCLKSREIKDFRPFGLCLRHENWILAGFIDGEIIDVKLQEVQNVIVTDNTFYPDMEWSAKKHFAKKSKMN